MSAKNYLSSRERNLSKILEYLPDIRQQKFNRVGSDYPSLSGSPSTVINRNINYAFEVQPYATEPYERVTTPFSDFFSDSETGTPDIRSEESDSSAGSALRRNTAEASQSLAAEWERIERTIYDEDGEKVTRPQLLEECKQWRELHPQLRVIGRGLPLPDRKHCYRQMEHDEIIAIHYSDYEQFSESEERLSESSNDVTPQNSPRASVINQFTEEPKLSREKLNQNYINNLPDSFCSLLQITPMNIRSSLRKRQNSSILKSEISSSKWMKNSRPESSVNSDRNSAKSYMSLDMRNFNNMVLSATERCKVLNNRVLTARHREGAKLEPLYTPELSQNVLHDGKYMNGGNYPNKKISLPPLLVEEEKRKSVSPKRLISTKRRGACKSFYQLDRRHN